MNNLSCFFAQSFMRIWLIMLVIFGLGALSVRAEYFYVATNSVPVSPYTNWATAATNIQDAVNVATNTGDIVLVSNGVYTTTTPTSAGDANNIVALTNQIILKSLNGPATTVIDGNYPAVTARVVLIYQQATLDGFTVRNGFVNYSSSRGGGISITYNTGGIVTNCIVHNNFSYYFGGGISIRSATGIVANCTIYSNSCTYGGGGMEATYVAAGTMVNNCVFWRNNTTHPTIGEGGGGLFSHGNNTVKNCLFYQNDSYRNGGGITAGYWYPLIFENCTLTANTATNEGGGFYMDTANTEVAARNTIIYNNSAGVNYADAWMTNLNVLTNCAIRDTNGVPNWNTSGNITNNPQFVDAATNNYRLMSGSPCINAGLNQSWMTDAVDLDGGKRIFNGIVDMGAYEYFFQGTICKVW